MSDLGVAQVVQSSPLRRPVERLSGKTKMPLETP
jgi:hypothetical protein